ncbi:MAG: hypothetical protein U5K43_15305 [Halofilum sp. (in: g-proteobacteria)]|nr:hypothetical protein [Halofilum sp. (in: g-proteobacteria)]
MPGLPTPRPPDARAARRPGHAAAARQRARRAGWRRLAGWRPIAAAAALVLAFGAGLVAQQVRDGQPSGAAVEQVALERGGSQEVRLAFSTPQRLDSVELELRLPPGVSLAGRPGQRVVRWQTGLAAGRNLLRLPLEVAADAPGGELVARVHHAGGTREWKVALEPRPDQTSLAPRDEVAALGNNHFIRAT